MFTGVVLMLVGIIEIAKRKLVPTGNVSILINDQKTITVPVGGKLLGALASNEVFVSSACGGGGRAPSAVRPGGHGETAVLVRRR